MGGGGIVKEDFAIQMAYNVQVPLSVQLCD